MTYNKNTNRKLAMIILGIDYGTKNIGLAISDETGLVAGVLPILHNNDDEKAINNLLEIIFSHKVAAVLMGAPMRERETDMFIKIKEFAAKLEARSGLSVKLWDESYSSQTVERNLRGKRRKKSDSLAAQLLLQEYLDYLRETKKT